MRLLKQNGFCQIRIPKKTTDLFEKTLNTFSASQTFRFPPQERMPFDAWPAIYKESYVNLEKIAQKCYFDLCFELSQLQVIKDKSSLSGDITFETSFMNIFNYKYGFLKPHRDRCLVTIIYRQFSNAVVGQEVVKEDDNVNPNTKILWSHDVSYTPTEDKAHWINVDNMLCAEENQVCVFIGEEMSTLCGNYLTANEHCVTENPNLPYIVRNGNPSDRMSLAFVLSSPAISTYIENMNLCINTISTDGVANY